MRIDKYLKVTRLVKRRSVAKDLCDNGRVFVGDRVIKGSYDVKIGDRIKVVYGYRETIVLVTGLKETVRKEDVGELYDLISSENIREGE